MILEVYFGDGPLATARGSEAAVLARLGRHICELCVQACRDPGPETSNYLMLFLFLAQGSRGEMRATGSQFLDTIARVVQPLWMLVADW